MNKNKVLAGIDLGSGSIRLKIMQLTDKGETQLLENVTRTIAIGKDTFASGRISPDMVEEVCQVLIGFKRLMSEYKVQVKRVVGTSAMREAENSDYVLEQIRVRTGLTVELISEAEERYLTRQAAFAAVPDFREKAAKGLLYTRIGSGTTQIAAYTDKGMNFSQTTQMGTLRILGMLSSIEGQTLRYQDVMEEFLISNMDYILRKGRQQSYTQYLVSGSMSDKIYEICKGKAPRKTSGKISFQAFNKVYRSMLSMSAADIAEQYGMEMERARRMIPTMMIIHTVSSYMKLEEITFSFAGLLDGILWELAGTKESEQQRSDSMADILFYTRMVADRFQCDQAHSEQVEKYAMMLFDAMQKAHGLTDRHRLILRMAAYLHDAGKFMNITDHAEHSAQIATSLEFSGITTEEQRMMATVIRFHEDVELIAEDPEYQRLGRKNRLILSKLVTFLRLANALDYSHRQKFTAVKVNVTGGRLVISATAHQNATLENWKVMGFGESVSDILGLSLELHIKGGE